MPIDMNPPLYGPGFNGFKEVVHYFNNCPDTEINDQNRIHLQSLVYCLAHGYVESTTPIKYSKFLAWAARDCMTATTDVFKYPGLRFKTTQRGMRYLICYKSFNELWMDHSAYARLGL